MVVHHHRQVISRIAVRFDENLIVQNTVLNADFAPNQIGKGGPPLSRNLEPDDELLFFGPGGRSFGINFPAESVIAGRETFLLGLLADLLPTGLAAGGAN